MTQAHPYKPFEAMPVWKVLNQGIADLEANGDVEEKTARAYILGYLSKLMVESGLLADADAPTSAQTSER